MMRRKDPHAPKIARDWVDGPAITASADELRAWLDAQAGRLVQVAFEYGDEPRIGALEVRINDAALGIGIADRARRCAHDVCAFISEAYWQDGTLSLRDTSMQPISPAELAAFTHLRVAR